MNIFTTAWKNMLRYKRRTTITAIAIAVGVFFALVMDSYLVGMDESSKANLIAYETSSAKIYAEDYFDERDTYPTDILIEAEEAKSIESFLDNANVSAIYSPRYVSSCEIIFREDYFTTGGSLYGVLYGVDPVKEGEVYKAPSNITEGEWLTRSSDDTSPDFNAVEGLVIGSWLAEDMKAEIGYNVTVVCKGRGGFIQTIDVPITGIVQTENPTINASAAYIDLAYLDDMLELEGAVTEYSVDLGSLNVIDSQYKKLAALSPELPERIELYSWRDIAADYITFVETKSMTTDIIIFVICLIAIVGITNTILMAVMERKNEIGMLRTLGYTGGYIKRLFAAEGFCIGLLGAIGGILLSIPFIVYMVEIGINVTASKEIVGGYRITGIMRSAWHVQAFILIPFGALIVSALSAWIPSGSLLRREIAAIFRKV